MRDLRMKRRREGVPPMEHRGKRKLLRFVFGRTMILVIMLLLQLLVLVASARWLQDYRGVFNFAMTVFGVLAIIWVVNERAEPSFRIMWLVIIAAAPVFGVLLYIFVKLQIGTKMTNQRLGSIIRETRSLLKQDPDVKRDLVEVSPLTARFSTYMSEYAGFPIYRNTEAKYFPLGDDAFEEMKIQLEKAEKFNFLEYFILAPGVMWDAILEILERKVKEGVEVRLMYDGTCCFSLLPHDYPKEMEKRGIQCKVFMPLKPVLSTSQNNRDHRKILIVDGKVAFTGGINLADEYINQKVRFGHWKDTAVMIHGDAVMSFTLMFLQVWDITEKYLDSFENYIVKDLKKIALQSDGYVLPYSDSPLDDERVGEEVYLNMIHTATRYVHIMTPYLILDHEMLDSLQHAGKKGLDVKIIMPHIPDKWYAFWLAKTYYEELIRAGVEIYEYTPGFVHAKSFVTDDKKAAVGTINLDFRSLYLHFECGVFFYRNKVVKEVEEDFSQTLKSCQRVTLADCRNLAWYKKLVGSLLRIVAPLM